jgi:hypothetical protein
MTARLLLLAVISLAAACAATVATAAAIVTIPAIVVEHDKLLAPGTVSLLGAALALAYGLLRPHKPAAADDEAAQASATERLPCASIAADSATPDSANPAATHSGDA